jgi:isoleucyl-tRNA synthetase
MAPILSFTAEEMWSYIPNVKKYYPSVYMSKWPEVTEEFLDEELESQWDFILKIRSAIYKTFEKNRIKDDINNLSQAHIILYTNVNENYSLLDKNVENLPEIFMVSRVGLMPLDSPVPDGIYVLDGVDGLSMEIRHTTGEKCERCLIYSDTVGTSEQYPTLCDKCIFVLDGETDYA